MTTTLDVGDAVSVSGRFYDESGALVDPATITLEIAPPTGDHEIVSVGFEHTETGVYAYQVVLDQEGLWAFRWESTDPQSAAQDVILAQGSATASIPTSLVTEAQYRWLTKDWTTSAEDVLQSLVDAQSLIEEYLRRYLTMAERTETLPMWVDPATIQSFVYPSATPVTAIPATASYSIAYEGAALSGVTASELQVGVDWWAWGPWDDYGSLSYAPAGPLRFAAVTYTGGFTTETLPVTIRRAIARAALALTRTTPAATLVAGAKSLTVGDISVTKPGSGAADVNELDTLVPGLTATLRKWRRKTVRY